MNHCLMMIPFWGNFLPHDGYAGLEREGKHFLELVEPEAAEVAVLPFDGSELIDFRDHRVVPAVRDLAARFVERARAAGLKTIVIMNSDSNQPIDLPDILVFRTSLSSRTRGPNEFALPAWHEDLVGNHLGGQIKLSEWNEIPSVGFCGLAATSGPPLRRRVKMLFRELVRPLGIHIDHNDGIYLRRSAMLALSACPRVRTQFVARSQYFGGAVENEQVKARVRREYVDNLVSSDYALSARGYGNFSFRFFETMSVGRSPVLIDTECVLPYDFIHDYRDYCVIVPERGIDQIGGAVADFHVRLTREGYVDLQRRIREFWLEWLSPEGFFRNLPAHWRERVPGRRGSLA